VPSAPTTRNVPASRRPAVRFGTKPVQTAVPAANAPDVRIVRPAALAVHETSTEPAVVRTDAVIRNGFPARSAVAALGRASEIAAELRVKTLSEPSSRPHAQLMPIGSTADTYRCRASGLTATALARDSTCPCAHESVLSTSLTQAAAPRSCASRPSARRANARTASWKGETA